MQNFVIEKTKKNQQERAILIAVRFSYQQRGEIENSLDELALLTNTAGAKIVARIVQERKHIDPAHFIGKGKAKELSGLTKKLCADLIILDDDLSPAQTKNLENLTGTKVIDRSSLILDVFAKRAKTKEAKTQVELAQLNYLLPRLTRQWTHLSRQEGGIGTRGPGEKQLEVDRRLIQKRIKLLTIELGKIQKQRNTRRQARKDIYKIALVGYTNTGKSTLLNVLTESNVLTENRLFATLDPTIRALNLGNLTRCLIIDTVGFIRKLPHHLIASFRSTIEEAATADLLLHVVDISNPLFIDQVDTVKQVLIELKIETKPIIMVFNKIDLIKESTIYTRLKQEYEQSVFISAEKGYFLQTLVEQIKKFCHQEMIQLEFVVRDNTGAVFSELRSLGVILDVSCGEDELQVKYKISRINLKKLETRLQKKFNLILDKNLKEFKVELN